MGVFFKATLGYIYMEFVKVETPDGESTESVVLQCMSSEEGEEVVTQERLFFPTSSTVFEEKKKSFLVASKHRLDDDDEEEDVGVLVSASHVRALLTNFANDTGKSSSISPQIGIIHAHTRLSKNQNEYQIAHFICCCCCCFCSLLELRWLCTDQTMQSTEKLR